MCMLCRSLCVLFSFAHCVVCPSIYGFWLPLWYLQTILTYIFMSSIVLVSIVVIYQPLPRMKFIFQSSYITLELAVCFKIRAICIATRITQLYDESWYVISTLIPQIYDEDWYLKTTLITQLYDEGWYFISTLIPQIYDEGLYFTVENNYTTPSCHQEW